MDPIGPMQGISGSTIQGALKPTKSYIGEDGNLLPDAEKLDLQNNSWSVWDGNDWKPTSSNLMNQAAKDVTTALKAQIMLR
ncbi:MULTISPECIES: hypothetical protein [Burkholderiaceae]|uniref:hypothetical protein n=1 Tax=Burkholderiaceae TaxID=119060 RepID=UPI00096704EB|nr:MULTISPECIES: hypothetical protein [Burkholderiaceae]MCG1017933.1 hypothetical protein [Mycetohabitans sp. B4]SIT70166.1 hypothetical protein SAMN04487768_1891 [Burkholderia sp. b13]